MGEATIILATVEKVDEVLDLGDLLLRQRRKAIQLLVGAPFWAERFPPIEP